MIDKTDLKRTENILLNYRLNLLEVTNLKLELEELKDSEYIGMSAISYEERTGCTNKISDGCASEVLLKEKQIEQLERNIRTKERWLKRVDNSIGILDQVEKKVVELAYLSPDKHTWVGIANAVMLDADHVRKNIKSKILNKLTPLLKVSKYIV